MPTADCPPPLTERQNAALDLLEETARRPEMRVRFDFEPGGIQLVNNYCVFHSRTRYEDHPEPERKRHLLRLWPSVPNSRPRPFERVASRSETVDQRQAGAVDRLHRP